MLPENSPQKKLVDVVSRQLHSGSYFEGAKSVAEWFAETTKGAVPPTNTKAQADELLGILLHWLLDNDGYEEAAQLLWGPMQFDPRPESTRRVWAAFESSNFTLLMGAGSMSKSYSMGVRLFLEWVRDPQYTTIKVLGPSEQHLEDNLFTHLVQLHRGSTIPLPGQIGKLFIGLDSRERKSSITGVVVPLGKKAAGRLQGVKRMNRKKEHPKFGKQTRMFIFLDEIANIPKGIWRDIDNQITNSSGNGLKIVGAFNPTDQQDEVGIRTEPPTGWSMFDPENDHEWVSTRGWRVVRLDAARCENVLAKRVVYPGLQTYEGFQMLIKNSGGMDSPGYWSMGRGCFPPTGVPMSIIPAGLLANFKAEFIWVDRPEPCGAVDLAFLGGDTAVFVKGSYGLASGVKFLPSLLHPEGRTLMFKNHRGINAPKNVVQAEVLLKLPKGDTVAIEHEILRIARSFSIKPEWLCVDKTGNGMGVFDLLRHDFGEVTGLNFFESASETRIMVEDLDTAKNLYDRANSELWFALRKFIEFEYCKLSPSFDTEELYPQLTGRRFRMTGKKSHVEKKDDYQSRSNGKSPDEADALTLLIHGVRKASGFVPGMAVENSTEDLENDRSDVRIDVTNKFEDL